MEFVDRNSTFFTIKVLGKQEVYKTIKFYDFTSARKMMTRIVQNTETGALFVLSKGADSAILSKCIGRPVLARKQGQRHTLDQGDLDGFNAEEADIVDNIETFAS